MCRFHRGKAVHLLQRPWPRSQDVPAPAPASTCRHRVERCETEPKQLIQQKARRPSAEWIAPPPVEILLAWALYARRDALPLARCSFSYSRRYRGPDFRRRATSVFLFRFFVNLREHTHANTQVPTEIFFSSSWRSFSASALI